MTDTRPFHERRRQQFLTEHCYVNSARNQQGLIKVHFENLALAEAAGDAELDTHFIYMETLWAWMLDYTAGMPIEQLAPRIAGIVDLFEVWNASEATWRAQHPSDEAEDGARNSPANIPWDISADYQDTLQLLSIAILLRDRSSVKRIVYVLRGHRGRDGLLEALITPYVEDEYDIDHCLIEEPYDALLQAYYVESDAESVDAVRDYLDRWYPGMSDQLRWYNSHLRIGESGIASYFGYWALEAAAVVFLLDLDDSEIDHLVYPKDLVAHAKALRAIGRYNDADAGAGSAPE